MYGVAALGRRGGEHVADLLKADLISNMIQLGCTTTAELRERRSAKTQLISLSQSAL